MDIGTALLKICRKKVFNVYTHFFSYISNPTYLQKNTVTYADCWNKKMFDMRFKLVSNALSKKNWCAAGHELIDLVVFDDLSDIYAYNELIDLYKQHIQGEKI